MTYSALIRATALKLGLPKKDVAMIASALFDEIILNLCSEKVIKIPRFGTIKKRKRINSPNSGYIKIIQSRLITQLFNLTSKSQGVI